LALQGIEDKMEVKKQKLAERAASDFPEGEALKDFVSQLKAKRISPEAFFRMCDSGYKKEITYEAFRFGINKLGLKLSKTQLMRLEYVVDEDGSKKITLEEF
jgi:Ca2+-binding EF-hand superfamily protein